MEEDLIKKIAINSAKRRISPQTGFIQYWRDDPYLPRQDTIPTLENFIYAYALFRTKTVEHIQEGKALLEKLLAFEVEGNFPVYLHEFPKCMDSRLPFQILPVFTYLLKDYSLALGDVWTRKIKALLERMTALLNLQETNPPRSPEEWAKFIIQLQMKDEPFPEDKVLWNSKLGVFIQGCHQRWQEGYEPAVTLFDLFMDQCGKRALNSDHPVHLKAALVQPWKKQSPKAVDDPFVALIDEKERQCLTFYWGSLERVHSLVLEAKKGTWTIQESVNQWICTYSYDELVPSEEESMEWAFYLDDSTDHNILISGQKATLFHPDDVVSIESQGVTVLLQVQVDSSQGTWTGHISKGDRSFQKSKTLPYGGYDLKMGWRTLQRKPDSKIAICIKVQKD
jgi:hypothetical protein